MSIRRASCLRVLSRNALHRNRAQVDRTVWLVKRHSSTQSRQWSTPLAKTLAEAITTTGPISIAQYMRQCLTSPDGGYYTTRDNATDQFGKGGDFVTSPEISQIFGELVGIWFLAEWISQGKKSSGVQLVELGPGRGTLMDDMLRTIANFKAMAEAIETIYLVEASPLLRAAQKDLLCGKERQLQEHPLGHQCTSKRLRNANIVWIEDVNFMPREPHKTPFIVAHEFFDALPIHAFQSTTPPPRSSITTSTTPSRLPNEWRELLVSPTAPPSTISPPSTPPPEFELTLSRTSTPHSRLLPTLSPRYAALLPTAGSTIEISPAALTTAATLAQHISGTNTSKSHSPGHPPPSNSKSDSPPSGAALIIDYGPATTVPIATLRGIRQHARTPSPFAAPGRVDLSGDVDFTALAEAALAAAPDVEVHGPVEQGLWLEVMGGRERCEALVRGAVGRGDKVGGGGVESGSGDDGKGILELQERVESGWRRLVERGPNGMGRLYKVMAVVPEGGGKRRPVGFGGDVVGG